MRFKKINWYSLAYPQAVTNKIIFNSMFVIQISNVPTSKDNFHMFIARRRKNKSTNVDKNFRYCTRDITKV